MTDLEKYQQFVRSRLHELTPFLQNYALGDFSDSIRVPEDEDEFTELIVGLKLMVEDFREMMMEREKTENVLKLRLAVIHLSYKISSDFHKLSLDQIDDGINTVLQSVARFVRASRSSLFLFSDDLRRMSNTHEWVANTDDSQIELVQDIPFETFGSHAETLKRHEIISISTLADYPPEAIAEKEWVEKHGFRSMLFVPLLWQAKLMGALGFYGEVGREIIWSEEDTRLLQLVAEILAETINRQTIEQNNTRLARILEDSLNEIYVFDADTLLFSLVNRAACDNLGYARYEFLELTPLNLKPEFSEEGYSELLAPLQDGSKKMIQFETVHRRKDGTTYDIEVYLQLVSTPLNSSFVAIIMDISERKLADQALRSSENKYRRLVETANEGVWISDKKWKTTFINQRMCEMLGFSSSELLGQTAKSYTFEDDETNQIRRMQKREKGITERYEHRYRHKNGSEVWVLLSVTPIMDPNGDFDGAFGMAADISEQKQAEKILQDYTHQLEQNNKQLETFNRLAIDREQRMIELKGEVNQLNEALGKEPPFDISFAEN